MDNTPSSIKNTLNAALLKLLTFHKTISINKLFSFSIVSWNLSRTYGSETSETTELRSATATLFYVSKKSYPLVSANAFWATLDTASHAMPFVYEFSYGICSHIATMSVPYITSRSRMVFSSYDNGIHTSPSLSYISNTMVPFQLQRNAWQTFPRLLRL